MTTEPTPGDAELDRALDAWGRADLAGRPGDAAAVARILAHADALSRTPVRRRHGLAPWLAGGGALAASVAVALLLAPRPPAGPAAAPVQLVATAPDAGASFALLYTPTIDEELML